MRSEDRGKPKVKDNEANEHRKDRIKNEERKKEKEKD